MNTVGFKAQYRPIRVGLWIPQGDFGALSEAIRFTTTLWGGRYNPIIPVGGAYDPSSIAASFAADILVPVGESEKLTAFVASDSYRSRGSWVGQLYVDSEQNRAY